MKGVWTGEKIKDKGKRIKVGGAGRRQAKVRDKRQETNNPSFRLQWVFCRSDKGRRDASDVATWIWMQDAAGDLWSPT
jgi:hypothetical protein